MSADKPTVGLFLRANKKLNNEAKTLNQENSQPELF